MRECAACDNSLDSHYRVWTTKDKAINLPDPPADLRDKYICSYCYTDGPTLADRIYARMAGGIFIVGSKCECGGTKANTTHSTWCPVFK